MKLPNGYGSIKKLSGKRRRPFMACEGKSGLQKVLGYFATREEALAALAKYNTNPWDLDAGKVTLQELFNLWVEKRSIKLSHSNARGLKAAYGHCQKLADKPYKSIKAYEMQDCIDNCGYSYSTQGAIKNLWGHLDRFALELDVITTQYSPLLTSDPAPDSNRVPFTEDEIALLWQNADSFGVDTVLFLIYSGYRVSEMLSLTKDRVDLKNWLLHGGVKTQAGKNRIVPVHSKIKKIVETRYNNAPGEYLFSDNEKPMYYVQYSRQYWKPIMNTLHMKHTPHETRHTFRSRLDSAGANQVCIDRMMGHTSEGTGKKVYTHKEIEELRLNIELVTK